ncbi:unnamed protein product, partial [Prorocentrum cordatum]
RNHTRGNEATLFDEAVELLRPYRFALVFENKLVPGYVTEKIVNAFLAGSIPIYWGSSAVLDVFNADAFIYANAIQGSGDTSGADPLVGLDRATRQGLRTAFAVWAGGMLFARAVALTGAEMAPRRAWRGAEREH